MNKLFILTVLMIMSLLSCDVMGEKVTGNGNVNTKTHAVEPFSRLKIETVCKVEITQSDKEEVIVEADENLHDYIEIQQNGDQLKVRTRENVSFRSFEKLIIRIHVKAINDLNIASVGNVICTNELVADDLNVRVSSVGNTELKLNVGSTECKFSTVGRLLIEGAADKAVVKNSSVGGVNMEEFQAKVLRINNSSVGGIKVYASEEIYVTHSGVGGLTYAGNPQVKEIKDSGIGKVKQR